MPPRWLCVVIVAFWLSTTGWLFYRDLWPYLQPSQPPPLSLDPTDEVQLKRPATLWDVYQDGQKVFQGKTFVSHPSPEVFELSSDFTYRPVFNQGTVAAITDLWATPGFTQSATPWVLGFHASCVRIGGELTRVSFAGLYLTRLKSLYRIDPDGRLLDLEVYLTVEPESPLFRALFHGKVQEITALLHGEVHDGEFRPVVEFPDLDIKPYRLSPVRVPSGAGVIQPLHPLKRMRGLYPGQHWTMPVLEPLSLVTAALTAQQAELQTLVADVRPQPETFSAGRHRDIPCLVVDYRNADGQVVSVWVDERTGQVLRQEANLYGKKWVMERD
jgi:hypothetical protein